MVTAAALVSYAYHQAYPIVEKCLPECFEFINAARGASTSGGGNSSNTEKSSSMGGGADNTSGKVVVHCVAGINRSGVVATAAYMIATQTPVLDAIKHVHSKRGALLWNKSFVVQLCILARKHNLLGLRYVLHERAALAQWFG